MKLKEPTLLIYFTFRRLMRQLKIYIHWKLIKNTYTIIDIINLRMNGYIVCFPLNNRCWTHANTHKHSHSECSFCETLRTTFDFMSTNSINLFWTTLIPSQKRWATQSSVCTSLPSSISLNDIFNCDVNINAKILS